MIEKKLDFVNEIYIEIHSVSRAEKPHYHLYFAFMYLSAVMIVSTLALSLEFCHHQHYLCCCCASVLLCCLSCRNLGSLPITACDADVHASLLSPCTAVFSAV